MDSLACVLLVSLEKFALNKSMNVTLIHVRMKVNVKTSQETTTAHVFLDMKERTVKSTSMSARSHNVKTMQHV